MVNNMNMFVEEQQQNGIAKCNLREGNIQLENFEPYDPDQESQKSGKSLMQ